MEKHKIRPSELLLERNKQSDVISIVENEELHINKERLGVKVSTFLYKLQQPTKELTLQNSKILTALDISPHLVANTYAMQTLKTSTKTEHEFYTSREKSPQPNPKKDYEEASVKTTDKEETSQKKWSFFS